MMDKRLWPLLLVLTACGGGNDGGGATEQQLDAMSAEHANDTAEANEATAAPPSREVTSLDLSYAEVGDELVYGHFVVPADMIDPLPAVILIHEWWGLNDNIRAMASRLAAEGYIVLAVDLFGGRTADTPADARALMRSVLENPDAATDNLGQAIQFVEEVAMAPSIATLGWCLGGSWSLNAALSYPDRLDATIVYYGQVPSDVERLSLLDTPLIGFFGEADRGIPVASVRSFEAALLDLQKDVEIHVYPGARHAFANPSGNNYDARHAEDAWSKTLEFLRQELGSSVASGSGG